MIAALMNQKYRNGRYLKDHEIAHMMIALLMAGQHTSSASGSWALLHIANNPDIGYVSFSCNCFSFFFIDRKIARLCIKNKSRTSHHQMENCALSLTKNSETFLFSTPLFVRPSACTLPSTALCDMSETTSQFPLHSQPPPRMEFTLYPKETMSLHHPPSANPTHRYGRTRRSGTHTAGVILKVSLPKPSRPMLMRVVKRLTMDLALLAKELRVLTNPSVLESIGVLVNRLVFLS